jgi:hypothetical protein
MYLDTYFYFQRQDSMSCDTFASCYTSVGKFLNIVLESQIIYKGLGAIKPKDLNRIAKSDKVAYD